jgi:hypothetical protein
MTPLRVLLAVFVTALPAPCQDKGGYTDTPSLPGSRWRVHDAERPRPPAVSPGAAPGTGAPPPADAVVLFDGSDLSAWRGRKGPAAWKVASGAMEVDGTGDLESVRHFGDCQLHLEFATPAEAKGAGQGRGNSGVFLFGRYEVQILDSKDNETYADGQCAALYGQFPPDVNACRGPGEWQSYDIVFEAPRFGAGGELLRPARITVFHNGVLVHHHRELLGPTAHRALPRYEPHGEQGPIRLQDHGNPVRFRNIWVRPLPPRDA